MSKFKSGFIAVVGRPNVGKSTLLNRLIGQKILIVSDKPQATRNRIQCVLTTDDFQAVFLDTPGIHRPRHKLGEYMVTMAQNSLKDVDIILFMVEVDQHIGPGDRYIAELLQQTQTPVFLLINKIDTISREALLSIISMWNEAFKFTEYVGLSATKGDNCDRLMELISFYLPFGPKYYPEDMMTDQPERFIIAEIIREKILANTQEEIPHSVAVDIMSIEERGTTVFVSAEIYVERESQKGIVIGKRGHLLKKVGSLARADIERLLASKVFLELHVRTKKDWRNKQGTLSQLGYRRE